MAKMIGKTLRVLQCPYTCCSDTKNKGSAKAQERSQWLKDAEAEAEFTQDCPHGLSTTDQIAGRNACYECYVLSGGEPDPGDEGIFNG